VVHLKPLFKITICDDSRLAQRQISWAIKDWNVDISYAVNGEQAINAIHDKKAELLFLDLNMPVLDGFQVLQQIRDSNLKTKVIVVSGDIQKKSLQRVMELGACAFISKPIIPQDLTDIIKDLGLFEQLVPAINEPKTRAQFEKNNSCPTLLERIQETANIAMGKTADRLAELFDSFISLSIPKVNLITKPELYMMLKSSGSDDFTSTISQGFVGGGISGESIIITDKSGLPHISQFLGCSSEIDCDLEQDILFDVAGLLSSSFLKAFLQQLNIHHMNLGIPSIIDFEGQLTHLKHEQDLEKIMAVEMSYQVSNSETHCDLLLLFTTESIELMDERSELFSWPI